LHWTLSAQGCCQSQRLRPAFLWQRPWLLLHLLLRPALSCKPCQETMHSSKTLRLILHAQYMRAALGHQHAALDTLIIAEGAPLDAAHGSSAWKLDAADNPRQQCVEAGCGTSSMADIQAFGLQFVLPEDQWNSSLPTPPEHC
jgi:hypothetical protein